MNEENELGISIRARILPLIDGANQLMSQIENLPSTISNRMNETISSPTFQEGLSQKQIQQIENFASGKDVYEFQKIQERQRQFAEDLDIDMSSGRISKSTQGKWQKKFRRQGGMIEGFAEDLTEQLNESYFDFLDSDKKKMLLGAMNEGAAEAVENVEKLSREFERVADNINKSSTEARSFFDQLQTAGILTLAGSVINMGLDYWTRGEQIKGAERTSFDFQNPMAMFSQQKQYEAYKTTQERLRDYEIGGAGVGLAGGLGLAAIGGVSGGLGLLAAGAAGLYFGKSIGGKIASGKNIETQTEMEEQLKRRQEVYEQFNSMVEGSASYDILRSRTRARLGDTIFGVTQRFGIDGKLISENESLGPVDDYLGYTPTERLQMRNSFADRYGKWDEKLYGEQTTFARARGIDPGAIYGLDVTARMTGMDVGISGLDKARQIATATYGENVSSQRIVDVLNDLKTINEKMLDVNMNMDTREAAQIGMLPSLIFGKDSPFGRMGDKALQGLNAIDSLGKSGSFAEEAWLYQAYGGGDLNKFAERKKLGIVGSLENFNAIAAQLNRDYGGNEWMIERRLHTTKDDSILTAGPIPLIAKAIAEHPQGFTQEDFDKFKNDPKFKSMGPNEYQTKAGLAVSETEANRAEQQKIVIQIGDDYRKVINKMGLDWLHTWSELSTPMSNRIILENQLNNILGESVKRFKEFFLDGGKSSREFEEFRKREDAAREKILGKETNSDGTTKESLRKLEDRFKLDHSGSYNDWKKRQDSGWWKNTEKKLEDYVGHSAVSNLYEIKTREGYDPTGKNHAPNSPHYRGDALDIDVYNKTTGERIPKAAMGNYSDLMETFEGFAKSNRIVWGGDWNNKDVNHFEKQSNNPQPYIDYRELASAIKEALQDHQGKEIIIRDQTAGGITSEQMKEVSSNANSIFTGGR